MSGIEIFTARYTLVVFYRPHVLLRDKGKTINCKRRNRNSKLQNQNVVI
jgi:hypothetical protein